MIIAGTGHRQLLAGWDGYADDVKLLTRLLVRLLSFYEPSIVRTGCALGFDTALAIAALKLKIPLHSYVPFPGFDKYWTSPQQKTLQYILDASSDVIQVSPYAPLNKGNAGRMLQDRNKALVNDVDLVLALWNGSEGGTKNCLNYVDQQNINVVNIWDLYAIKYSLSMEEL